MRAEQCSESERRPSLDAASARASVVRMSCSGREAPSASASSHTKTRSNAALSTGAKTDDEEEEGEGEASPTETESNGASPPAPYLEGRAVSEMHGRTSARLTGNDPPSEVSTSTTAVGRGVVLAIFRPPNPRPGSNPIPRRRLPPSRRRSSGPRSPPRARERPSLPRRRRARKQWPYATRGKEPPKKSGVAPRRRGRAGDGRRALAWAKPSPTLTHRFARRAAS